MIVEEKKNLKLTLLYRVFLILININVSSEPSIWIFNRYITNLNFKRLRNDKSIVI